MHTYFLAYEPIQLPSCLFTYFLPGTQKFLQNYLLIHLPTYLPTFSPLCQLVHSVSYSLNCSIAYLFTGLLNCSLSLWFSFLFIHSPLSLLNNLTARIMTEVLKCLNTSTQILNWLLASLLTHLLNNLLTYFLLNDLLSSSHTHSFAYLIDCLLILFLDAFIKQGRKMTFFLL